MKFLVAFALVAGSANAQAQAAPPSPAPRPVAVAPAEKAAAAAITADVLRAHIRFLSDDLLEGRGPAGRGDRIAEQYIATEMEALGLEPGAPGGGWFQPMDVIGITSRAPDVVTFRKGASSLDLKRHDEVIVFSGLETPAPTLDNAEVVFAGYGIVAPEYGWNDYKDVDVKGKVLLLMNNDPENDPALFAGRTRLWYGRWDYKYNQAARKKALAKAGR